MEAFSFAQFCASTGLDPRKGEVSLIRFQKDAPAHPM